MSVILPTIRKVSHRGQGTGPESCPGKRGQRPKTLVVYVMVVLVLIGALALLKIIAGRLTRVRVLARFSEANVVLAHEAGLVIRTQEGEAMVDPEGRHLAFDRPFELYVTAGSWIVGAGSSQMNLISADSPNEEPVTLQLYAEEKPIYVRGGDIAVTARPDSGLKFGESWCLRGISGKGALLWQTKVPHVPFFAACNGDLLAIGAVDISGEGGPWIICLSKQTGERLWQEKLDPGLWRYLNICDSGQIRAVLDSAAYLFSADGSRLWVHYPDGKVVSATSIAGVTAIAIFRRLAEPISKTLGSSQVTALSHEGEVLWSRTSRDSCPRLFSAESSIVALESNHVVIFRSNDGHRILSAAVNGYPIAYAKGVIVIKEGGDIIMADLGIPDLVR